MSEDAVPVPRAAAPPRPAHRTGETADPGRRLYPRIIDSDWLLMRGMRRVISDVVAEAAKPGQTILDFGCGSKPYEPLFAHGGARYMGADFDGEADYPIDAAGHIGAPDACADMVVSFQVLEHVRDLDTYFSEALRVLRPDGQMILSTHGTWLYHPHPEDHRRWTRQGLIGDIEKGGFEVVRCEPVVGPMGWTHMIRLTGVCFLLKKGGLPGRLLAALLAAVVNARAWLEDKITPAWITRDNACVYVTLCRPRR
jgi:SAM-dependent methyltransferase